MLFSDASRPSQHGHHLPPRCLVLRSHHCPWPMSQRPHKNSLSWVHSAEENEANDYFRAVFTRSALRNGCEGGDAQHTYSHFIPRAKLKIYLQWPKQTTAREIPGVCSPACPQLCLEHSTNNHSTSATAFMSNTNPGPDPGPRRQSTSLKSPAACTKLTRGRGWAEHVWKGEELTSHAMEKQLPWNITTKPFSSPSQAALTPGQAGGFG